MELPKGILVLLEVRGGECGVKQDLWQIVFNVEKCHGY